MDKEGPVNDVAASLRSNWKFPAVVHFCRVFEGVLSLRQFSSDKFEAALLNPGDHSVFLSELISRLLYPGRKKNALNPETWPTWETNLLKKVKAHWTLTMEHNPLERQQHFVEVSSSEKLEILYLLTEMALQNSATLRDTIRNTVEDPYLTADSVRCLPIGEDGQGHRFFLFSLRYEDCRLYKQIKCATEGASVEIDESPPEWVTVTTTLEELRTFIRDLKRSKHTAEKKLHRYLLGILPEFERTERHRKKVEDRAALREQAPLLKRSSRLQEQAKRREKAKGQPRERKDIDISEMRNEEVGGEEGQNTFDLGISREERMRLRNQRRELAEKGLRRVLTGKKRVLEYDGLTPLGASVQCPRKKRIQNVRPSRNITKLVSIIWEKFRRPMHHRKQFEIHIEAAKKRRAAMLQNRNDFMARFRFQQRPAEGIATMRDARLSTQEAHRPPYVQQPSMASFFQHQRPVRSSYCFGSLPMPRPLQNTTDYGESPALNPTLQRVNLMRFTPQSRDIPGSYVVAQPSPVLSDTLRRPIVQQPRPYDISNNHNHGVILTQRPMQQGIMTREVMAVSRNASYPPSYTHRLPDGGYMRSVQSHGHPETAHHMTPTLDRLSGYPASLRNVRPQLGSNRLAPTLVQFPVSLQGALKPQWNGSVEIPKIPYVPPYRPPIPGQTHADGALPTLVHPYAFDNGARWPAASQLHESVNLSGPLSSAVLKRKRND